MPNGFTAACLSMKGLVRALGNTLPSMVSETSTGIMIVKDSDDLIARTKRNYPEGPTGGWSGEWWHVWNYLQYGVGACIVGGTGSVWGQKMDSYDTGTPLDTTSEPFNCIFNLDCNSSDAQGNSSSGMAACFTALTRPGVFAILGASEKLQYYYKTGDTGPGEPPPITGTLVNGYTYSQMYSFYGLRDGSSNPGIGPKQAVWTSLRGTTQSCIIVTGARKNYIKSWSNAGYDYTKIDVLHLASDFAGCLGRAIINGYPWSTPAGLVRGRILNAVRLEFEYSPDQRYNAANDGGIIIPETLPGKGILFMGNKTQANPTSSVSKLDFASIIAYLQRTIKDAAYNYLFEPNTANTRSAFKSYAESILAPIVASGSLGYSEVQCDATNQPPGGKTLYARIILQPVDKITTISLEAAITTDGGVTVSTTDVTNL